ncbi:MAG: hypothetical protein C0507_00015 [Cyanobacteria bacterium PR.3.49]|nr:hypothetical protein [Cyanobacteria bacterium PR.3.49]
MATVGILGGGQLGMLLAESIYRYGGTVAVYDPDVNAPAHRLAAKSFMKPFTDSDALTEFFNFSDVVTYEFENVESAPLYPLAKVKPILPSVKVLAICQDRIQEKEFLRDNNLPYANFATAKTIRHLEKEARAFQRPFIIKTARGGYDGKGQWLINTTAELETLLDDTDLLKHEGSGFVIESVINIAMEVSCIVVRNPSGKDYVYPVFENMHKNHILDFTVFPARLPLEVADKLQDIALATAKKMDVHGLLCIEFFLSHRRSPNSSGITVGDWNIYINEMAPRPHNSGHVTRVASSVSQFDSLARVLLNIPLAQPKGLERGSYCMGNLLGDVFLAQGTNGKKPLNLQALDAFPEVVDVVIYGKHEAREKRKMGHFVTLGDTADEAHNQAVRFRESLMLSRVE